MGPTTMANPNHAEQPSAGMLCRFIQFRDYTRNDTPKPDMKVRSSSRFELQGKSQALRGRLSLSMIPADSGSGPERGCHARHKFHLNFPILTTSTCRLLVNRTTTNTPDISHYHAFHPIIHYWLVHT
jgi:hypothetical protein